MHRMTSHLSSQLGNFTNQVLKIPRGQTNDRISSTDRKRPEKYSKGQLFWKSQLAHRWRRITLSEQKALRVMHYKGHLFSEQWVGSTSYESLLQCQRKPLEDTRESTNTKEMLEIASNNDDFWISGNLDFMISMLKCTYGRRHEFQSTQQITLNLNLLLRGVPGRDECSKNEE